MTAKIKLNAASGGGSVSLEAPTSTTGNANIELKLPVADGSGFLKSDGSGNLSNSLTTSGTDNFTIADGNLVIGTSGHGIDFSATSGTGTSELLADYEEGTFTPTLPNGGGSVSFTNNCAKYIKIGNIVHIFCDIGSIANHAVADMTIGGFPYTSSSTNASTTTILTGRADPGTGVTVSVFDSASQCNVRSEFQSDGLKGSIFNSHGLHFNLTYLTN